MRMTSLGTLFLLLVTGPLSFGGEETMIAGSKRVVSPYKAVFRGLPKGTPSKTIVDGPLLGNGDMGVCIAGIDKGQRFWLCKNDFWKLALDYKLGPSGPRPFGGVDMKFPGFAGGSDTEQHLYDAVTVSRYTAHKGGARVEVRSWVAASENMLVVELTASGKDLDVEVNLWVQEGNGSEVAGSTPNGSQWATRKFTEQVEIATEVACAVRPLGAGALTFKLKVGQPVTILTSMQSAFKSRAPLADVRKRIDGMDPAALAELKKKHAVWWRAFWAKSFVEVGDPLLEQRYYLSNYIMASASRDPEFPPPIFGIWNTTDSPGWMGDYHLNYNHQAPFYALYSCNHIEQADPYHAPILDFRQRAQWYARNVLNIRGAYYPVGIGPKGIETTRNHPTDGYARPAHVQTEGVFYHQRSNGAYCIVNIAMRWRHTYDADYAEVLYPLVRDVADFWEDYLEFEDGRYVIHRDSVHERSGNGNDFNSIVSIGLVRNALELAIDMSGELGIDSRRHEKWRHILDNLSGWFDGNGMNSFYPAAVRVGYDPEVILAKLRQMVTTMGAPNGFIKRNPHGIENCSIVPNTINEMLCMGHRGVLRVFPVWPKDKDARFRNLRTVGAFLVSGELKNGKVQQVRIESEKGRPCTMVNPWPGKTVVLHRNGKQSETLVGKRLGFDTKQNESVLFVPALSE